jgi:hypothetical protein
MKKCATITSGEIKSRTGIPTTIMPGTIWVQQQKQSFSSDSGLEGRSFCEFSEGLTTAIILAGSLTLSEIETATRLSQARSSSRQSYGAAMFTPV